MKNYTKLSNTKNMQVYKIQIGEQVIFCSAKIGEKVIWISPLEPDGLFSTSVTPDNVEALDYEAKGFNLTEKSKKAILSYNDAWLHKTA